MDRTKDFLSYLPSTYNDTPLVPEPTVIAAADAASIEIIKVLAVCLQRLDKLTPQLLRRPESRVRGWVSGLCRCAGVELKFKKPSLRDERGLQPSTVAEVEEEVSQLRESLAVAKECTDALERQFESTLRMRGTFGLKSKVLPLLQQRQVLIAILRAFYADLMEALQRYEVRALSWQVATNDVFDPRRVSEESGDRQLNLPSLNPKFAERYEQDLKEDLTKLQEEWREQLKSDSKETERILETATSKTSVGHTSVGHTSVGHTSLSTSPIAGTVITQREAEAIEDPPTILVRPTFDSAQVQTYLPREDVADDIVLDISAKIVRITELMSTFTNRVVEQKEVTDNILTTTECAIGSMQKAGKYLMDASRRKWTYKTILFVGYIGCALFLLLIDLLSTWRLI